MMTVYRCVKAILSATPKKITNNYLHKEERIKETARVNCKIKAINK